jgi:hypothetical protein
MQLLVELLFLGIPVAWVVTSCSYIIMLAQLARPWTVA